MYGQQHVTLYTCSSKLVNLDIVSCNAVERVSCITTCAGPHSMECCVGLLKFIDIDNNKDCRGTSLRTPVDMHYKKQANRFHDISFSNSGLEMGYCRFKVSINFYINLAAIF
jgi:hypothetical protein